MDRLEAVADVGQGARHDHAHRVVEVAHPHLVLDADALGCRPGRRSRSRSPRSDRGHGGHVSGGSGRARRAASPRSGRRSRRRAMSTAHRAADGSRRVETESRPPSAGQLRQRVAHDPGAMAVVVSRGAIAASRRTKAVTAGRVDEGQRAERPGERLLDVRLGVADEVAEDGQAARRRPRGSRPSAAVDERDRRDRAADEAALPARRRVDELLELGPAVRLAEDALADRDGRGCRRVIQSPASRAARRRSCQVRSGSTSDEPLEQAEGEPAHLELGLAGTGDRRRTRRPPTGSRRVRVAEAAGDRGEERPAHAEHRPDAGRDPALARRVLRVGEARGSRAPGLRANASGSSPTQAGQARRRGAPRSARPVAPPRAAVARVAWSARASRPTVRPARRAQGVRRSGTSRKP